MFIVIKFVLSTILLEMLAGILLLSYESSDSDLRRWE